MHEASFFFFLPVAAGLLCPSPGQSPGAPSAETASDSSSLTKQKRDPYAPAIPALRIPPFPCQGKVFLTVKLFRLTYLLSRFQSHKILGASGQNRSGRREKDWFCRSLSRDWGASRVSGNAEFLRPMSPMRLGSQVPVPPPAHFPYLITTESLPKTSFSSSSIAGWIRHFA